MFCPLCRSMIVLICGALLAPSLAFAETPPNSAVKLTQKGSDVVVTIAGKPFTTLHTAGAAKPYFSPLVAANGVQITRSLDKDAIKDHPHHKGLWVSVDEVNEQRHWVEKQKIITRDLKLTPATGDVPAEISMLNEWLDDNGKPIVKELEIIHITGDRLIEYDITFNAADDEPVTFADTKEGFVAVRLRDELREKGGDGTILASDGSKGEAATWGHAFPWIDYSGTAKSSAQNDDQEDASKPLAVGVTLFDHPHNFRPARYHVRAYGLFAISPFGESAYTNGKAPKQPVTLKPGESLRLRYAVYVHSGEVSPKAIEARYQRYAQIP